MKKEKKEEKSWKWWLWSMYSLYSFIAILWVMTVSVRMSDWHTAIGLSTIPWMYISFNHSMDKWK